MNTVFLLMAQYGARAVIPVEDVCRDYFPHLTLRSFCVRSAQARSRFRSSGRRKARRARRVCTSSTWPTISTNGELQLSER